MLTSFSVSLTSWGYTSWKKNISKIICKKEGTWRFTFQVMFITEPLFHTTNGERKIVITSMACPSSRSKVTTHTHSSQAEKRAQGSEPSGLSTSSPAAASDAPPPRDTELSKGSMATNSVSNPNSYCYEHTTALTVLFSENILIAVEKLSPWCCYLHRTHNKTSISVSALDMPSQVKPTLPEVDCLLAEVHLIIPSDLFQLAQMSALMSADLSGACISSRTLI